MNRDSTFGPGPIPASELLKLTENLEREVRIEGDHIVLEVDGHPYYVPLHRCDTHAKMLDWVSHLSEKAWMSAPRLRRFIDLACDHHKIKVPRNA